MVDYEIYALRYAGPFLRRRAFLVWLDDWDTSQQIYYYLWLIKGGGTAVVVDAGVGPELAAQRELDGYVSPARILEGLKRELRGRVEATDIDNEAYRAYLLRGVRHRDKKYIFVLRRERHGRKDEFIGF